MSRLPLATLPAFRAAATLQALGCAVLRAFVAACGGRDCAWPSTLDGHAGLQAVRTRGVADAVQQARMLRALDAMWATGTRAAALLNAVPAGADTPAADMDVMVAIRCAAAGVRASSD